MPERRAANVQTAAQIFMNCTNGSDESLVLKSTVVLRLFFLAMPEFDCLPLKERNNLVQGLSDASVQMMISSLVSEELNQEYLKSISNNMASARLIRFAKPREPSLLSRLQEFCVLSTGTRLLPFNVDYDESYQLRIRSQWILTIYALIERGNEIGQSIDPELPARKTQLTTELIDLVLPRISDDESYKKFSCILVEALSCNDLEVARQCSQRFQPIHQSCSRNS